MGFILVVLSAFGFSTLGVLAKAAFAVGFTRDQMLFYRFAGSLPVLFLLVWKMKAAPARAVDWINPALVGAVGIGLEATFYFISVQEVGAALTGVFLYLYPAFVALLSHFFLHERLNGRQWSWIAVALVGCFLTADIGGLGLSLKGWTFGILTGLWYGIYLLAGNRVMKKLHPLATSTGIVLGAALVFGALVARAGAGWFPAGVNQWSEWSLNHAWPIVGLIILGSLLPFTTLYLGMKRVGAVMASVLSTVELVFTLVLATLFTDEKLTLLQWSGGVLVLASTIFIHRSQHKLS